MDNQTTRPEAESEERDENASAPVPTIETWHDLWPSLSPEERRAKFLEASRSDAEELFLNLSPADQSELLREMPNIQRRSWIRMLAPDDAADLIQQFDSEEKDQLVSLLDSVTQKEVTALLAYAEDNAGGLMNSRFVRLRPDVSVDVAIRYLRAQARKSVESIHYAYVLDPQQKLLGVVSFRDLLLSHPDKMVQEIMETDVITIPEDLDQEEVSRRFSLHNYTALPVVDKENHVKGIITVDDIVAVVEQEATEDIQKLGGMEALEAPYFDIAFSSMIKKRAGWLMFLFLGEMFTASAMSYFQIEIERAVVLALFIPLIISSGGNSGSQATTLIIRAMALGEIKLRDWWKVFFRELSSGLALGFILGLIGLARILFWPSSATLYGEHYALISITVACSLVGIVTWGTLAGSMLPFALRKLGLDPASASAPFVATLVDVTGLIIYFTMASIFLSGTLL